MIAGLVGVVDLHVDPPVWHLADVAAYPLASYCGATLPDPMNRRIRPARLVRVDDVCAECVQVWGRAGRRGLTGAG